MTLEQEALLKETHETVRSIQQELKGYNGRKGLCAEFEDHKKEDKDFRNIFYNFRLAVIVAGALFFGGSGFGFAKLLDMMR